MTETGERRALGRAVVALSIAETASWGVLFYAYAVLMRPIAAELGTSEATAAGAFSVALLASGVASRPAGRAVDRWGARRVMTIGALFGALAFALLAAVTNVAALYLIWTLVGLARAAVLYEPAFAAVTSWFPVERDRLRALLVVTSVAGLASTIFLPATDALLGVLGWRLAVIALAVILAAVVVPSHALLPGARPATGPSPAGERRGPRPAITSISTVFAIHAFASTGAAVHLVAHLEDTGATAARAAWIGALTGAAQVMGRFGSGLLRAVVGTRHRLPLLLATQAAALAALTGKVGPSTPVAVALFGAANGLATLERATLVAERFGTAGYGETSGRIAAVSLFARAGAPLAVGISKAHGGAHVAFFGLAGILAFGALLGGIDAGHASRHSTPG